MSQAKNTDSLQNFARRLADLSEKRALRQVDIVRKLNATPAQVGNWFQGRNGPGKHAEALATLLGTTKEWLLEGRYSQNYRTTELPVEEPASPSSLVLRATGPLLSPAFQDYLRFLRGCREEAERLGAGDPIRTAAIFDKMLDAWSDTMRGKASSPEEARDRTPGAEPPPASSEESSAVREAKRIGEEQAFRKAAEILAKAAPGTQPKAKEG